MTLTPACDACCSTAAPEVASIESMMSTLTPSPIMLWAIWENRAVLPPAFWMSGGTPAALSAACSSGWS